MKISQKSLEQVCGHQAVLKDWISNQYGFHDEFHNRLRRKFE